MSWDFRAPGTPHPSYRFSGIVEEVVLQAKHVLAMSTFNKVKAFAFNKAKVLGGRYSIPIYSNGGLTKLNDDQDVIDMLVFVLETRPIDTSYIMGLIAMRVANIAPNRGVVIEELDDNYGAIVPLGGKCKQ
ncbi:unnamed protein product [Prunus armeniaca]|uniref:Uncharacterized protein n=1 Tax=Prunus armeniaca TaxID=36596 RepID=A0A6J5VB54_PRUAR|nr:unnamed protein product [Prunus armeniaca]